MTDPRRDREADPGRDDEAGPGRDREAGRVGTAVPGGRLEERYRLALRLLPRAYRQVWEEDMVAAFLATMRTDDQDSADYLADYGRPPWPEVASVALLAIRLRVGAAGAPARYVAWGAALRLVVLCGFLTHAVLAAVDLGVRLWLTGHLPFAPAAPAEWVAGAPTDPWHVALGVISRIWLPAFVALALGHWRVARLLASLAILPSAAAALVAAADLVAGGPPPFVVTHWTVLLFNVLLVVALVAFEAEHEPAPRRPWLVALPIGMVAVAAPSLVPSAAHLPVLLDWPGLCCLAVVVGAVLHGLRGPGRAPAWTHAWAVMAGTGLALRLLTLVDYAMLDNASDRRLALALGLAQAAAVLAVLVPLVRRTRSLLSAAR
jgi:hypothetical protein